MEKGKLIFLDVFRRADKNDDGALSLDEFKSFFNDGVMSNHELEDLFHEIDTHNTNNIDTDELCTYFSQKLGAFKEVFGAIEDMTSSITNTLAETAKTYPDKPRVDQFTTRFLMHEIINQMSALQRPLEAASDRVDEDASQSRNVVNIEVEENKEKEIVPGRVGRRIKRQISSQTSAQFEDAGTNVSLNSQVRKLQALVDHLENRINFEGISEEQINIENEKCMLLVHRTLRVREPDMKEFRNSLRNYVEGANIDSNCLNLSIRSYKDTTKFVLYEVWEGERAWKIHLGSHVSKSFQHNNIDHLEVPEQCNTMPIPSAWWKRDE